MKIYEKDVEQMLFQFLTDAINDLAPERAKEISFRIAKDYTIKWIEKYFRYPEMPGDLTSK